MVGLRVSGVTGDTEVGGGSMSMVVSMWWVVRRVFSAQKFWINMMGNHWTNTKRDVVVMVRTFIMAAAFDRIGYVLK